MTAGVEQFGVRSVAITLAPVRAAGIATLPPGGHVEDGLAGCDGQRLDQPGAQGCYDIGDRRIVTGGPHARCRALRSRSEVLIEIVMMDHFPGRGGTDFHIPSIGRRRSRRQTTICTGCGSQNELAAVGREACTGLQRRHSPRSKGCTMAGYGQFCPVAKAMEVLDERWTILIVRELLLGSRHFNEIRRGVPRMSPALLTKRLRGLERAGVLSRSEVDGRSATRSPQWVWNCSRWCRR